MSIAPSHKDHLENWDQIRDDWIAEVDRLFQEIETWAQLEDWATARYVTTLDEEGLGQYPIPRLLVHAPEGRFIFEPMARRVMGNALGLIDISKMPSMAALLMMTRQPDGHWAIHPFGDSEISNPWNRSNFLQAAQLILNSTD